MEENTNQSQPVFEQTTEEPGLHQSRFGRPRFLGIIAIVLAIIVGYTTLANFENWFPFGSKGAAVKNPISIPSLSYSPVPTIDAGLKIYRNEEYKLEIEYPSDLIMRDFSSKRYSYEKESFAAGFGYDQLPFNTFSDIANYIRFFIYTDEAWKSEHGQAFNVHDAVTYIDSPAVKGEIIRIAGQEAAELYNGPNSIMNVTLAHGGFVFIFAPAYRSFDNNAKIFFSIISTFKFIK
jgi:hypothetical protein